MSVFGEDRHEEDLGEDLAEGNDPFGEADPGACQPKPEHCDFEPYSLDAPPEASEVPVMDIGTPEVFTVVKSSVTLPPSGRSPR